MSPPGPGPGRLVEQALTPGDGRLAERRADELDLEEVVGTRQVGRSRRRRVPQRCDERRRVGHHDDLRLPGRRVHERRNPAPRKVALWEENEAIRKKFGQAVALCAKDLTAAEARLADARSQANAEWDRMRTDVENTKARLIAQAKSELETWAALRADVTKWLGLKDDASTWAVEQRIRQLKTSCDADSRVERAEADLSRARHALQSALNSITPKDAAA